MDFSLVIPVLNESAKIATDIANAATWLSSHFQHAEIIIADDGSRDDTCAVARNVDVPASVRLVVLQSQIHRGKGFALRRGIAHSSGKCVMFADSGSTVPWKFANHGIELVSQGDCQIAHASRYLPQSYFILPHSMKRKIFSAVFRRLIRNTLPVPSKLTDTQCGFKIYLGEVARKLYAQARLDGFLIDIEIILIAAEKRYKIIEFPIDWHSDPDSRLNLKVNLGIIYDEWRQLRRYKFK